MSPSNELGHRTRAQVRGPAGSGAHAGRRAACVRAPPRSAGAGLPRGGVPVAYEVARALHAPLDVFVVRKLGVPGHEEIAMGAIATGGGRVLNRDTIQQLGISMSRVDEVTAFEQRELERRERAYRGYASLPRSAAGAR